MSEVPVEPVAEPATPVEPAPVEPAPVDPSAPVENAPEVLPSDPSPELRAGDVVFFDAPVFGESEPAVFAGIVLHAGDGRARVHTLGRAADSADFPAADLRLNT